MASHKTKNINKVMLIDALWWMCAWMGENCKVKCFEWSSRLENRYINTNHLPFSCTLSGEYYEYRYYIFLNASVFVASTKHMHTSFRETENYAAHILPLHSRRSAGVTHNIYNGFVPFACPGETCQWNSMFTLRALELIHLSGTLQSFTVINCTWTCPAKTC